MIETKYLTVPEASDFLRVSKSTLNKWRCWGVGPPFMKVGARKVVYRIEDLEAWVAGGGQATVDMRKRA